MQEFKVERTLGALRELLPQQVEVLRDGKVAWLLADQLVPGDDVVLEQGNNIPADCGLIEAFGVRVNNATVTDKDCPDSRPIVPRGIGKVVAIPRVGGPHHRYERLAA